MGGKRFRAKAMRAQKAHISLLPLATLVAPILGQLQFNGGVSSSSNSNGNSANRNTNRPTSADVDEKFFLGGDTPSLVPEPGLQLLWKEEEASQLWRQPLPWRSWSW